MRRTGLDVVYVGGDPPRESWAQSVARLRPAAVVIGVPASDDVLAVRHTLAALTAAAADLAGRLTGEPVSRGSR